MLTVLIVDDEIMARRGVAQGVDWERRGCRVAGEAANGEEGVALAEKLRPGLIITDIRMPHMDGKEFLHYMKGNPLYSHIPVVILSSEDSTTERIQLLEEGAADFILKPFNPMELKARVKKYLVYGHGTRHD